MPTALFLAGLAGLVAGLGGARDDPPHVVLSVLAVAGVAAVYLSLALYASRGRVRALVVAMLSLLGYAIVYFVSDFELKFFGEPDRTSATDVAATLAFVAGVFALVMALLSWLRPRPREQQPAGESYRLR